MTNSLSGDGGFLFFAIIGAIAFAASNSPAGKSGLQAELMAWMTTNRTSCAEPMAKYIA